MKQAMVLRRRRAERLARSRRRDTLLAICSLLIHLLIFLLLPGLAVEIKPPQELLIELVRPAVAGGRGQNQSDPAPAAEVAQAAQPDSAPLDERASMPDAPAETTPVQEPAPDQVPVDSAEKNQESTSPAVNDATTITSAPVTVNESPQQVEDRPVAPPAAEVIDEQVRQPEAQAMTPLKPAEEHETESAPAETSTTATNEVPAADEAPAAAEDAPAGEQSSEDQAETGDGGDDEGEGAPPGPSAAELRLLGEYGDAARLRIRSQARNPEQGGSGTVTFEFEVASDGHLIDVRVIRSSGYANLDNDALEATRAAFNERKEKVPFPSDVTVASWVFVMSMKYPLY